MHRPLLSNLALGVLAIAFIAAGAALLVFAVVHATTYGFWTRVVLSGIAAWFVACGMALVATRNDELSGPSLRARTA